MDHQTRNNTDERIGYIIRSIEDIDRKLCKIKECQENLDVKTERHWSELNNRLTDIEGLISSWKKIAKISRMLLIVIVAIATFRLGDIHNLFK